MTNLNALTALIALTRFPQLTDEAKDFFNVRSVQSARLEEFCAALLSELFSGDECCFVVTEITFVRGHDDDTVPLGMFADLSQPVGDVLHSRLQSINRYRMEE